MNQIFPVQYETVPYNNEYAVGGNDERFLPFLAGVALTAPLWAGGFGRRCCYPPFAPFPYPLPTPYASPYPLPTPFASPYTFNTYSGMVGSPYNYYYGRPYPY